MTSIRVLLVDDHKVMREGLRMVLSRDARLEVVGEADDGLAAVSLAQSLRPHVVVLDISMPGHDGLKATGLLKTVSPGTKILILTRHAEGSYVQQLMSAGADGYVLKQSGADELMRGISRVTSDQTYLDQAIADQVILPNVPNRTAGATTRSGRVLSEREEDVLRFVALGFLAKEIGSLLGISVKTVQTHKTNAMSKMGLTSRIDIVRYAMLQGWLQQN
jgi:two-component system response regulator NreC